MILYSNDCPKCKIIKQRLDDAKLKYEIFNDVEKMIEMGFASMPILETNEGKRLVFHEAISFLNK